MYDFWLQPISSEGSFDLWSRSRGIDLGLENIDYKIIGYVSMIPQEIDFSHHHYVKPIDKMI
jgi:hypothetical protein